MKFISWNVNGLRACVQKGFLDIFNELDADIFCLQETKLQEGQIDLELPGYHQYWNYAEKKDTPAQLFSPKKNRCLFLTASVFRNTIRKAVSSPWNLPIFTLSRSTHQTPRVSLPAFLTAWSGKLLF